jgi:Na+-translocating ferredoxin:NAD+ oxidoreductase subunit A
MEIKILFFTAIILIFINNYILPRIIGQSPFFTIFPKPESALKIGLAVTIVMIFSSIIYFIIVKYLFSIELNMLRGIVFILINIIFIQTVKILLKNFFPSIFQSIGIFFPYLLLTCAFMGTAISIFNDESVSIYCNELIESIVQGFGAGSAFTIALVLILGILDRLELAEVPDKLKGIPITIIVVGLLALVFSGFSGIRI